MSKKQEALEKRAERLARQIGNAAYKLSVLKDAYDLTQEKMKNLDVWDDYCHDLGLAPEHTADDCTA